MSEEEKKSTLYFIYLRYCGGKPEKSFDEFEKLSIEELKTLIEELKKNAS